MTGEGLAPALRRAFVEAASAAETPHEALRAACELLCERTGARRVSLWGHDQADRSVSVCTFGGDRAPGGLDHYRLWRTPLDDFPAARRALEDGRATRLADTAREPGLPEGLVWGARVESAWVTPLGAMGVHGLLVVEPCDPEIEAAVQAVLPDLASLLAAVGASELADARQAEIAMLQEIVETTGTESLSVALGRICSRIARRVGVDRASVFVVDEGRLVPRMSAYADERPQPEAFERFLAVQQSSPILDRVLATGRPAVVEQPANLTGWWRDTFGVGSLLVVPIGQAPDAVGVLALDGAEAGKFTSAQVRLASTVASHLPEVIDTHRANERRIRDLRVATTTRRLLTESAVATSIEEVAEALARAARDGIEADFAVAFLVDAAGGHLFGVDLPPEETHQAMRWSARLSPASLPLWRHLQETERSVFVSDTTDDRLLPEELIEDTRVSAYVAIPLCADDRLLGIVGCGMVGGPRRWGRTDAAIVDALHVTGSMVVEHAVLRAAEQERNEHLAEALERESRTVTELNEANEVRQAFLSAVAHDLRTPLTVVRMTTSMILDDSITLDRAAERNMIERLEANGARLEKMLDDLLDIDRLSRNVVKTKRERVDVASIVGEVVGPLERDGIRVKRPEGPLIAWVDRVQVERIVENLILNALKFCGRDVTLTIGLQRDGQALVIHIDDDGPGVPEDLKATIFDPFKRMEKHRAIAGSGVGLSLVRRFAELHGGRAWVEDSPEGGASFRVALARAFVGSASRSSISA